MPGAHLTGEPEEGFDGELVGPDAPDEPPAEFDVNQDEMDDCFKRRTA
jgi:hypothetical protein